MIARSAEGVRNRTETEEVLCDRCARACHREGGRAHRKDRSYVLTFRWIDDCGQAVAMT